MKRYGKHLFLAGGIVGVGALLLGWNVAMWMQTYLEEINNDIARLQLQLREVTDEIKQNKSYHQKWASISGFQRSPVVERKNMIERHLQSLGTVFDAFSPTKGEPIQENPEFQELSYVFDFSADLSDLTEFLGKLDHSDELLRITRLDMKRNPQSRPVSQSLFLRVPDTVRSGALTVRITVSLPAAQQPPEPTSEGRRFP